MIRSYNADGAVLVQITYSRPPNRLGGVISLAPGEVLVVGTFIQVWTDGKGKRYFTIEDGGEHTPEKVKL